LSETNIVVGGAACANVLAAIVRERRSVRGFLRKAVPRETIREIFDLARFTPSNCNIQPWIAHVVSGEKLNHVRAAMMHASNTGPLVGDFPALGAFPEPVYRGRQIEAARALYAAMGIARGDNAGRAAALARNFQVFDAPHAAFIFLDAALGLREAADCGLYAQTVLLAMAACGIASCAQGAVSFVADAVRGELGIPASQRMLFGIAFGYEDTSVPANAGRTGRAPLEHNVTFYE
jgi:nitroreductase